MSYNVEDNLEKELILSKNPVTPRLRSPEYIPFSIWETEAQRQCLARHQTGGYCGLNIRFHISFSFLCKSTINLIHCITNQGDCFNTMIVPSAIQMDAVCGPS